jgi:hypothetical protein
LWFGAVHEARIGQRRDQRVKMSATAPPMVSASGTSARALQKHLTLQNL